MPAPAAQAADGFTSVTSLQAGRYWIPHRVQPGVAAHHVLGKVQIHRKERVAQAQRPADELLPRFRHRHPGHFLHHHPEQDVIRIGIHPPVVGRVVRRRRRIGAHESDPVRIRVGVAGSEIRRQRIGDVRSENAQEFGGCELPARIDIAGGGDGGVRGVAGDAGLHLQAIGDRHSPDVWNCGDGRVVAQVAQNRIGQLETPLLLQHENHLGGEHLGDAADPEMQIGRHLLLGRQVGVSGDPDSDAPLRRFDDDHRAWNCLACGKPVQRRLPGWRERLMRQDVRGCVRRRGEQRDPEQRQQQQ